MTFRILCSFILLTVLVLVFNSCSNPQKDYEPVQQLQLASEHAIVSTSDDSTKLKYSDSVIVAIKDFINNHPKGEWNLTAKSALEHWQAKRDSIYKSLQVRNDSLQEVMSRETDFEEIQKLQVAAEDVMQHSSDYAVRMKSCSDMMNALQSYLVKHPTGEWSTSVQTSFLSWKSRRAELVQGLRSLLDMLSSLMKQRAIQEAQKVHNWSNVESVQLEKSDTTTVGGLIHVTSTYAVRMVAALMRSSIYKLEITVSGSIDPEAKRPFVDSNVRVVE